MGLHPYCTKPSFLKTRLVGHGSARKISIIKASTRENIKANINIQLNTTIEHDDMNNQKLEKAESVPVDTGVEVMENKSIVYSKIFGSTKGVLGEGSIKMKLTDKFFQCPTIMGKQLIKAIMNKKKAETIIKQIQITQTNTKHQKNENEHMINSGVPNEQIMYSKVFNSTKGYPGEGPNLCLSTNHNTRTNKNKNKNK